MVTLTALLLLLQLGKDLGNGAVMEQPSLILLSSAQSRRVNVDANSRNLMLGNLVLSGVELGVKLLKL